MSEAGCVSVIIPSWNLWEMTAACLRSLAEHTREAHAAGQVEVLVVDNGSTDATATELEPLGRALWGQAFQPLRLPENLGFAKACNAGARAATGDLLFFLNNDTTLTSGWLPPLRAALADKRLGAVGPLLLYPDGTVQHCGVYVTPFLKVGHLHEHFPGGHPVPRKKRPLQAITGAAVMLRKEVFWECNGFCEDYVNGFEDLDLCYALRRKGFKLAVAGESVLYHHTSQTPGRFDQDLRNSMIFRRRYGKDLRSDLHYLAALDGYCLHISPSLACWLTLPEAREQELNATFAGAAFDEAACRAQLEKEPLWRGGWLLLMDYLDKQGRMGEALEAGLRCVDFFPERQIWGRLLHLARKAGVHAALPGLMQRIREDEESDPAASLSRVRAARRKAYADGDRLLAELLDGWLLRYARE